MNATFSPYLSRIFFLVDVKQTSYDGTADKTTQRVRVGVTRHYRGPGGLNWVTLGDRFLRGITIRRLSNGEWNREDRDGSEGGKREIQIAERSRRSRLVEKRSTRPFCTRSSLTCQRISTEFVKSRRRYFRRLLCRNAVWLFKPPLLFLNREFLDLPQKFQEAHKSENLRLL